MTDESGRNNDTSRIEIKASDVGFVGRGRPADEVGKHSRIYYSAHNDLAMTDALLTTRDRPGVAYVDYIPDCSAMVAAKIARGRAVIETAAPSLGRI